MNLFPTFPPQKMHFLTPTGTPQMHYTTPQGYQILE